MIIQDPEVHDKTTAELLKDLSMQMTALVHHEVRLAKAEVSEKTKKVGAGVGLLGGAGIVAVLALGALVAAAIAGLSEVLAVWAASLIVAAILLAMAGVLGLVGKTGVKKGGSPVPEQALASSKEDVTWLKTQAQSARP